MPALRIEFPGAAYHLTSRGDRREPIYADDRDRAAQLGIVALALERFDAQMRAYCLMGNHDHFLLHACAANLSRLMRQLNGMHTQHVNRRHGLRRQCVKSPPGGRSAPKSACVDIPAQSVAYDVWANSACPERCCIDMSFLLWLKYLTLGIQARSFRTRIVRWLRDPWPVATAAAVDDDFT